MKDILAPLLLIAAYLAAVRYVDRHPAVKPWWARFGEETAKRRFWKHLRPERRLSIIGVAIVFASIALMAIFSGTDAKPPFFLFGPLLLLASLGALIAFYGFALAFLTRYGLRDP